MKEKGVDVFERRLREVAAQATALPAPADAWEQIAARVRAGEAVLLPARPPRAVTVMAVLRVAGVVLFAAGAAAAAGLPGSPVRQWLAAFTGGEATEPNPPAAGATQATSPAPQPRPETAFVLEPANGGIVVALEAPQSDVIVRVRFVATGEPELRATGLAAGARFRSGAGRLTVMNASGAELILTIPRTLARIRVEVDGQPYLTMEDGQIRVLAPAADTAGSEILLQITR